MEEGLQEENGGRKSKQSAGWIVLSGEAFHPGHAEDAFSHLAGVVRDAGHGCGQGGREQT